MKNVAESVKARLQNRARAEGLQFSSLLEEFALARIFARLSESRYSDQFILKGAQLFTLWADTPQRPTRDADFLSFGSPDPVELASIFDEICQIESEPADGLEWTPAQAAPIREDNIYGGVRIKFFGLLGKVKIPVQIDVGFGDSITPEATTAEWQMPLDYPSVTLRVYCPETSIAEKLQAAPWRFWEGVPSSKSAIQK
ncbi:MAG: nucleotidyl transferase AbiEii/AbiGii toxin family protein [Verrucomicrobiales bacterium]|nr:nucleotidyl transferase AbiEii/AbiGii toxin family protein [Verrucomicrobiales bacterium]